MLTIDDIEDLMSQLAERRPVFHSEADFQHELAWLIRARAGYRPLLEYPFQMDRGSNREYIDIWLPNTGVAIELKYQTNKLKITLSGESFQLTNQSRGPQVRYDFLENAQRLENLNLPGYKVGFVILLTNSPAIWNPPSKPKLVDPCFRLHEFDDHHNTREITGRLAWAPESVQAKKGPRTSDIYLKESYRLHWEDYKKQNVERNARFRYLVFRVKPQSKGANL